MSASDRELRPLTPEEIVAHNEQQSRRRRPRFPLDLTATLAERFVNRDTTEGNERDRYTSAARHAIMLLDACQEELLRDADAHSLNDTFAAQQAVVLENRKHVERLCKDGIAPFKNGLLYITGQRGMTEALPLFKRWRRSIQEHPTIFHPAAGAPGLNAEAAVRTEVERYHGTGFDLATLEQFHRAFAAWYEEFEKPSVRARAGQIGGKAAKKRKK